MASQTIFQTVYRGRQSFLHHAAYMRMAKVLLTLQLLEKAGIDLAGKTIFDYGFGAGTFFRYCPTDTQIFGVEIDPINAAGVEQMLRQRGYKNVCLRAINLSQWEQHPLLQEEYDIVICSHVLEHLPDPVRFLNRIKNCLKENGVFAGLVPINERRKNPHHVQIVNQDTIERWMADSGMKMRCYLESDPWIYWLQPIFTYDSGSGHELAHTIAQVASLAIGIPATVLGYRLWERCSPLFARLTGSKATQAAFIADRTN